MKISIIAIIATIAILAVGGYAVEDEDFAADVGLTAEINEDLDVNSDFAANTDVEVEDVNDQRELGRCETKYWGWYNGYWCHCDGKKYKGKCNDGYDCDEYWWGDCKYKKCYYKHGGYAYKEKIRCRGSDSDSDSDSDSGGSACKRRERKCCSCVDSCEDDHGSSSSEEDCIKDDCKTKCKKAADKCSGYKKSEWEDFYDHEC